MKRENDNLDPFEQEWLSAAANQVESLRKGRSGCPGVQLIQAAQAQALPGELQSAVAAHVETCPSCRQLAADLSAAIGDEMPEPDAERILKRVQREIPKNSDSKAVRFWPWKTLLAAAGLAICSFALWQVMKPATHPGSSRPAIAESRVPDLPRPQSVLTLEKPEVKLTLAVLTWRGSSENREQFAKDIAPALDLYRADNFAGAEPLLSALSSKYPDSVEVLFYLGICRLFLGRHASAAEALEKASSTKDDSFTADISWYLGLAYQRSGRIREARTQFAALCSGSSIFTQRACAAVKELDAASASR